METKISNLHRDERNFNRHTEQGMELLRKSLKELGAGRSILLDKNGRIIAGNGVAEAAEAVGIDFTNTLKSELGIKHTRSGALANAIDLPTATKDGTYNITAFTKKMLDVFPALKDDYKEHVAIYGNFLYLNFFGEKLVPQIKEVLLENNKKSVKKLFDVFETIYIQGDRDTVNTVVAVIAAACVNDETAKANAIAALGDNKHFVDALTQFIPVIASNKKLSAALIK